MEYMSSAQAAEKLGVDVSTVVRWIQNGKMVAGRIGKGQTTAYVIDPKEVERMKQQRRANGKE
jgi:excisionase family DNA binding protein